MTNFATAAAFLSLIGVRATSAARYELMGVGKNLFNNHQLDKKDLPNRIYADITWNGEDDEVVAEGMLGSGAQDADDDGIFHFSAKCVAISDDKTMFYVGGEVVGMPGKPMSERRELQACPGDNPNVPNNQNENGLDVARGTPAGSSATGAGNCGALFWTACIRCGNTYDAGSQNPQNDCPPDRNRRMLSRTGCTDNEEEECDHGSQGVYAFELGESQAVGFHVPTEGHFHWSCEGFKEFAEGISFELDTLTGGEFNVVGIRE